MEPSLIDTVAQIPIVATLLIAIGYAMKIMDQRDATLRTFLKDEREQSAILSAQAVEANKGMAIAINELSIQIRKNTELLRVTAATMAGENGNDHLKKLIEQMD